MKVCKYTLLRTVKYKPHNGNNDNNKQNTMKYTIKLLKIEFQRNAYCLLCAIDIYTYFTFDFFYYHVYICIYFNVFPMICVLLFIHYLCVFLYNQKD